MKPWEMLWRNHWFGTENVILLLYGDVRTTVKNWQFQFLFFLKKSMYRILYQKILSNPNLELANVIQQKVLIFVASIRYRVWSFVLWMIARHGNHMRSSVNVQKKTKRSNLFEAEKISILEKHLQILRMMFCSYFLLFMSFNVFIVIVYTFYVIFIYE